MGVLVLVDPVVGTTTDATLIAANDAAIKAVINGGIDASNFGAGLIFNPNKIQQGGAAVGQGLWWDGAKWAPASSELAYAENTGTVNVTATTPGTAQSIVIAPSVTFDGSTLASIEFYASDVQPDTVAAGRRIIIGLWDNGTLLGIFGYLYSQAAGVSEVVSMIGRRRLTPSAGAHVYEARGFVTAGTAIVAGSTGTGGTDNPIFIRITKG